MQPHPNVIGTKPFRCQSLGNRFGSLGQPGYWWPTRQKTPVSPTLTLLLLHLNRLASTSRLIPLGNYEPHLILPPRALFSPSTRPSILSLDSRPHQHPSAEQPTNISSIAYHLTTHDATSDLPTVPKHGAQENPLHLPRLQGPATAYRGRLQLLQRSLLRQAPAAGGPQVHRARRRQ